MRYLGADWRWLKVPINLLIFVHFGQVNEASQLLENDLMNLLTLLTLITLMTLMTLMSFGPI